MNEVFMDDDSDLYSSLSETIDIAKSNLLKATLQAFLGILVITFIVLLDHPALGLLGNSTIQFGFEKEFWVLKYFFIFAAAFYVAISLSYIVRSKSHIHEARSLLERLER